MNFSTFCKAHFANLLFQVELGGCLDPEEQHMKFYLQDDLLSCLFAWN